MKVNGLSVTLIKADNEIFITFKKSDIIQLITSGIALGKLSLLITT
jgi:hypothetical protein